MGAENGERSCGDCGMCCKLMGVQALAKPPHAWCGHFRKGAGCAIYADRPRACADYACYWLQAKHLGPEWRPDRARFVLHREDDGQRLVVEVDPARPDAWRKPPFYGTLRVWAQQGAAKGLPLNVIVGERAWEMRPEGDVDLGVIRTLPR